jgi:succinate dehydrogenase/fumarate reductase flavoprotein subunit
MTQAHEAVETFSCDVLIIGSGGAGLMAALHAYDANPDLNIVVVAKGLIGKSGCTRLVQGGFNAVLEAGDSIERHFVDTLEGGAYLNDQELAWALVSDAPEIIRKLETKAGVFFDRSPDGTIHQKAFAGQSFDRTVHRGDQTGIEIMSRLHDQLLVRKIGRMDETRAIDLMPDSSGTRIAGALLLDQRTGDFVLARARVTLLATGGGPRMYTYSAPSLEKVGDGYAMAYRAGCELIDMEMMQFHPTGILAGASRLSGMVLEEGLRGAGAFLLNGAGERFMERYDPVRKERATRDVVSRAGYLEIMAGRGSPQGGVFLDASHLGADFVAKTFPGMVRRCAEVGYDLTREPVEVVPTAHFHMGGARIDADTRVQGFDGLLVAGEDAGGVHGANRLGGNGVAESCVFGARAGIAAAQICAAQAWAEPDAGTVERARDKALAPLRREGGASPFVVRDRIQRAMWEGAGLVRDAAGLRRTLDVLEDVEEQLATCGTTGDARWNLAWQQALDVRNLRLAAWLTTRAALARTESRGSHARRDYPERDDEGWLAHTVQQRGKDVTTLPVRLTRRKPGDPPLPRAVEAARA